MAYKNLLNETLTASSETEWFMRMRDFVCKRSSTNGWDYSTSGIGWTLHDSSYAVDEDNVAVNDWIVVYSTGELGVDRMYYQITLINDYIKIHGWQYWNNTTHAGSGIHYYRDSAMEIGADPEVIWIYGDLDFVHLVAVGVDGNTNWYNGAFGLLNTSHLMPLEGLTTPRNVQVCSSSLTAGPSATIVVPDSSSNLWGVGNDLMIMDQTNFEMITILANNGSGTIIATLANSYTTGAMISIMFPYFVVGSNTTHFFATNSCVMLHDMNGNHAGGLYENMNVTQAYSTVFNNIVGTGWNDAYAIVPFMVYDAAGTQQGFMGMLPHCGYTPGTGLVTHDLLDDVSDPTIRWRYNGVTNTRVIKELV